MDSSSRRNNNVAMRCPTDFSISRPVTRARVSVTKRSAKVSLQNFLRVGRLCPRLPIGARSPGGLRRWD